MDFVKKYLKWISTAFVLTGILLTNLNIYPLNIFSHGLGVVGWTCAGIINKDKAIMTELWITNPIVCFRLYKAIFLRIVGVLILKKKYRAIILKKNESKTFLNN